MIASTILAAAGQDWLKEPHPCRSTNKSSDAASWFARTLDGGFLNQFASATGRLSPVTLKN
jgi:hypothetical protein